MTLISENGQIVSPASLSNNFNFDNIVDDEDGHAYIPENKENLHHNFISENNVKDVTNTENNLSNE